VITSENPLNFSSSPPLAVWPHISTHLADSSKQEICCHPTYSLAKVQPAPFLPPAHAGQRYISSCTLEASCLGQGVEAMERPPEAPKKPPVKFLLLHHPLSSVATPYVCLCKVLGSVASGFCPLTPRPASNEEGTSFLFSAVLQLV
jgi:hypothetical protein